MTSHRGWDYSVNSMGKKEILKEGIGVLSTLTSRIKKTGASIDLSDIESPEQSFQRIYGKTAKTPLSPPETKAETVETEAPAPPEVSEDIATACVPCTIGHMSACAGLLNEAVRFKKDGLNSNQVMDDIGKCSMELNALERVDLTPEKIETTKGWERPIAEEALQQSRSLRHRLEEVKDMEELEKIAADTQKYYTKLNRDWYKGRLSKLNNQR